MADNTVIVRGLPLTCNPMKVKLRFESECKVHIESIKVEADCAEVKLANGEDCKTFRENLPSSITFGNNKHSLTIVDQNVLSAPSHTPTIASNTQSETNWSFSNLQTWSSLRQMPNCKCGILVQPSSESIHPVDIKDYFESNQLSRGGQIETILSMIDGIFISFKDESVAEKTWNFRPHRVNGKAVVVYLKSVPQTYRNRLVVKPCGDDRKLEELKTLMDQCSTKRLPTKVFKVCQSGAAFIVYESGVDEKDVLHVVEKFRTMNLSLEISFLLRSDCVLVEDVPCDISETEIRVLFENSQRTGGGNITRIDFLDKTSLLIYFASYLDADRVVEEFRDKVLQVFGKNLGIHRYFHNLHIRHKNIEKPRPDDEDFNALPRENGKPLEKKRTSIKRISYKDADPEILRFFVKRPEHVTLLNSRLSKLAVGRVSQNRKEMNFEMSENTNEKDVMLQVKKFLSDYTSVKCQITDYAMKQGIDSRLSSKGSQSEDDVCFRWVNNQKQELVISGLKAEVESFRQSLKQPSGSSTLRLAEEEIRWLLDTGALDQLKKDHPVIMGCNGKNISLSGNSGEISEGRQAILELLKKLRTRMFVSVEQDFMDFLLAAKTNENISTNVSELMKKEQLPATMVIKDDRTYIVGTADIIDTAEAVLKSALGFGESFEIGSEKLDSQRHVWRIIESLESEGKIRITLKGTVYSIVGFRVYVKGASEQLSWCDDVKFRKTIKMESGAAEHIVGFAEDFKKHTARHSILYELTNEGIVLKGKKKSIETVGDTVHKWSQSIEKRTLDVEKFGIVEFLKSNDGKDLLSNAEKEFRCTVSVTSKPNTQVESESNRNTSAGRTSVSGKSSITIGPLKISVRQGDITEETNDGIVNSVGHKFKLSQGMLSRAITSKGGPNIQSELSKRYDNEIRVTSSGKLKCKKIFHVVFPQDSKKFSECLVKVLQEADKRKCTSISIPAVGTGTGQLTNRTIANLMLRSFEEFVRKTSNINNLRTLDIVLFDSYQLADFKLEILSGSTDPGTREPITTQPSAQLKSYSATEHLSGAHKSLKIGSLSVSVREGDISEDDNHAIVNSTGPTFDLSNGMVSRAIVKRGGYTIQKLVRSTKGENIRVTSGGDLKCIKIIHVVAPNNPTAIGKRIGAILETAEKEFCPSLSIPAIGTGNLQLPVRTIAKVTLHAIHEFARKCPQTQSLTRLDIVIYDKQQIREFQEAFFDINKSLDDINSNRHETSSYDARPTGFPADRVVLRIFSFEKYKAEKALEFLKQQIDIKIEVRIKDVTKAFAPQPPASGRTIWEHLTIEEKWQPFDIAVCQSLEKSYQGYLKRPSYTFSYVQINSKHQQPVSFNTMSMGTTQIRRTELPGRAELAISNNHFGDSRNGGAASSNSGKWEHTDPAKGGRNK